MGALDLVLATAILGASVYVLYRKLWASGGRCGGCSHGCGVAKAGRCVPPGRGDG